MRFLAPTVLFASGCAATGDLKSCNEDDIRAAIEKEIQKGVKATIAEDIDAFMDGVPDDYRIVEDDGSITDKAALRDHALRGWAIIDKTTELKITINSVDVGSGCDEALVRTSQRWERLMRRRDDSGADTVLTTQEHEERWRLRNGRWYNYEIKELGGRIFINGEPYKP
jgi:hypothetical protein